MAESLEIRCFCDRTPLLAVCGRDAATGQAFVHVRAYRQRQVYAEVVITSGTARIRCRTCLRWHTVTIKQTKVEARPERLPSSISLAN